MLHFGEHDAQGVHRNHAAYTGQRDHSGAGVRLARRRICARFGRASGLAVARFGTGDRSGAHGRRGSEDWPPSSTSGSTPGTTATAKIFWQDPVYAPAPSGEEHVFDSQRMLELIKQEILDAANQGNCVLVGRGSACALARRPGCFHIFVYATASAKKDWFAQAFPDRAQHAEQDLAAFDRRRAAVIRKFYQQEWCSRGLYHMLLNSCIGTEAMIAAVQCAAGLCAAAPESVAR